VSDVELNLPDDLYAQLQRLADEEFVSEQDAIESLLAAGIDAYRPRNSDGEPGADLSEEFREEMWDTAGDPAARDDGGPDERTL